MTTMLPLEERIPSLAVSLTGVVLLGSAFSASGEVFSLDSPGFTFLAAGDDLEPLATLVLGLGSVGDLSSRALS